MAMTKGQRVRRVVKPAAKLPVVDSQVWLPVSSTKEEKALCSAFSIRYLKLGDDAPTVVNAYDLSRSGYVGIPRAVGLKSISKFIDNRSDGVAVAFPKLPTLRDYQEPFIEEMLHAAEHTPDFMAEAATGKGKTVCALYVIAKRGRAAVVVVDQENLARQWEERIQQHLGLPASAIGRVQGKVMDYKGKAITICMVQTLVRKELPQEFLEYFGTVVFDEAHTVGAPTFSLSLGVFRARVRFGVSATPDRPDALRSLVQWGIGSTQAVLTDELPPARIYIVENETVYSYQANISKMSGMYINEIAADGQRNMLIVDCVQYLYQQGRDTLVISDRVEHLQELYAACALAGIPTGDMGVFARCEALYVWQKDPRPPRKPPHWVKGTEYTPIKLCVAQKRIPKASLSTTESLATVVFGTYGFMSKGTDIPRLSAGIDATPRSASAQTRGRTLRVVPGKPVPIWVTIRDVNSYRAEYQLAQRAAEYSAGNGELFLWRLGKGHKPISLRDLRAELRESVAYLKSVEIRKNMLGNHVIVE